MTRVTNPTSYRAPSERSLALLYRLADERAWPAWGATGEERTTAAIAWVADDRPDQGAVSRRIDELMGAPRDLPPLEIGVYEVGEDIYVVKPNRSKTGLYAKKLVEIGGTRLAESGDRPSIEFVYAPGAISLIRPEHRMPVDRARTLTLVYGRCLNCGRTLKAAESVERGIGPVCIKAFAA